MREVAKSSVKLELIVLEGVLKIGEELTAEHSAQDADGQKESVATMHPALAVGADATTRNHAVQVRMGEEVLSPGVQERETADLRTQVFWVLGNRPQGFGSGTKQHRVDGAAILKRQRSELVREREHDMEVLHIENLSLTGLKPSRSSRPLTLWTMPVATRTVHRHLVTALLATLATGAQSRCPTLGQSIEDAKLLLRGSVALQISRTVDSDDIGHFRPMFAHFSGGVFFVSFSKSAISGRDGFPFAPTAT